MDGTETGWGRPAESAPRWRALLDRARFGGRHNEEAEGAERPARRAAASDERAPGRDGGNGYHGRASVGYPTNPPDEPLYSGQTGYHDVQDHPTHSRYAALDPGYQPESRYAALDPGYQPESRYAAPDRGYQAESRYAAQDPGYQPESRYAALDPRYRSESRYAPQDPDHVPGEAAYHPPAPTSPTWSAVPEDGYPATPVQSGYDPLPFRSGYDAAPVQPGYDPVPVRSGYDAAPVQPGYDPVPVQSGYDAAPVQPGYDPVPVQPDYRVSAGYPLAPDYRTHTPQQSAYRASAGVPPGDGRGAGAELVGLGTAGVAGWHPGQVDPETERIRAVLRSEFGLPRVLAFANPKGGVHKTTATVLAAATIGSVRGQGVLAWDDNELRGTLGLRAGSARHARTIRHLIAHLAEVEALHGTSLTDRLDDFLRHASDGSYDVLAGEESARFAARLDQHTVGRVLELLRRTHDVICVDTGNNVESVNWQTVLRTADQLVVTTVPREDAAFAADWMLDLLHEEGLTELADNAVTLLSCPTSERSPLLDDLQRHFATRTRAVAVVPYDPALETGSSIEYSQLRPETRAAWLRAASMMLEPFAR